MEKKILSLITSTLCLPIFALEYIKVEQTDGTIDQYHIEDITSIEFDSTILSKDSASYMDVKQNNGLVHSYNTELIDQVYFDSTTYASINLGLTSGTLWSTHNIGASIPEEIGLLFAWGEPYTKTDFTWSNYRWTDANSNGTATNIKKYYVKDSWVKGEVDNLTTLEPKEDAASILWGAEWRMPTKDECEELKKECEWEWTTVNKVPGFKVTGPNGKSIFLCVTSFKNGRYGTYSDYWTSTLYDSRSSYSYLMTAYYEDNNIVWGEDSKLERYMGMAIRPVRIKGANFSPEEVPNKDSLVIESTDTPFKFTVTSTTDYTVSVVKDAAKCRGLISIDVPKYVRIKDKVYTVTALGDDAFSNLGSLENISIPSTIKKIGKKGFASTAIKNIDIPDDATELGRQLFWGCKNLKTVKLPSGINTISEGMFQNSALTTIVIDTNITKIETDAFNECKSLTSISIPSSVTIIGQNAFYFCSALEILEIEPGLTEIGASAFRSCSKLTETTIPSTVTTIGDMAFYECKNLKLTIDNTEDNLKLDDFSLSSVKNVEYTK